ncbi:ABC transporter ATP-binding protein [Cognatishimia sp.]|uniref:ABC transporter ATP-binding protein n=1 Tax=Cognatishimia sp. TaxID=2211648 RepID=UPI003514EF71
MSLLSIQNLSLAIHDTPILKDVSLDIAEGEVCGIIGESGSGKSMTAFSVLQLLPEGSAAQGRIMLDGTDVLNADDTIMCGLRGRVAGMVFQEPMTALNPVQTIGQQVAETILIHEKVSRAEAMERAAQALTRCELPPEQFPMSRYPHELSGGQRQRVVIAMAIALRPKLLIADEPTTALDVTTQAEILQLLKQLVSEDGMSMMFITHDLAVVTGLADKIVIMKTGEVVERGNAATLQADMQHPYTKQLFAASTHQPDQLTQDSSDTILKVENAVRSYTLPRKSIFGAPGEFLAVNDVSFDIRKGECLGLVGESGCGKSTLTRCILGLEPLKSGQITLDGAPVTSDATQRRMQVVFQDPYGSFNPRHKVARLVSEPFFRLDRAATEKEIDEALVSVGLKPSDKHKYPHEFSGGQRQRIAIARALIIRPELIILDEAVSALDVSVRAQVLDLLVDLSREYGLTYLFITHDLSVVRSIADRILVMQRGKIVEQGDTDRVFDAPTSAYTRKLIAAAPKLPSPSTSTDI